MFDLSWAEIAVVMLVALLVIGPNELPHLIRSCKKLVYKVRCMSKELTSLIGEVENAGSLEQETKELNAHIARIVDLEGNLQETYDLSDVLPESQSTQKRSSSG